MGEDEAGVDVDVASVSEERNAAVVNLEEGGEVGAGEVGRLYAFSVGDVANREVPYNL